MRHAFFAIVILSGCKETPEKKAQNAAAANEKVCAKLDALAAGQTSPMQKDRCLAEIGTLGPNARACFDPCIDRAKDPIDYELCKDECTSKTGLAGSLCDTGYAWDEPGRTACVPALTSLQTSDRGKLACIGRCVRERPSAPSPIERDGTHEIDACSARCGGPALPARTIARTR